MFKCRFKWGERTTSPIPAWATGPWLQRRREEVGEFAGDGSEGEALEGEPAGLGGGRLAGVIVAKQQGGDFVKFPGVATMAA